MSPRRFVGVLLALFTAHLTMVAPDSECTSYGHDSHAAVMRGATMSSSTPDDGMGHGGSGMPCDAPISAHCCDAFASCTVAVALDTREQVFAAAALPSVVPTTSEQPLLSRARGPEPPPPKI